MSTVIVNTVSAAVVTIEAYGGDTFQTQLTFTDAGGNPINLALYTLEMYVKSNYAAQPVVTFTEGNGISKSGNVATLNKLLPLPGADYVYDFVGITISSGVIITFFKGLFSVEQNITTFTSAGVWQ